MKRDKFRTERVSEKRSSNSKKTWGMKLLYFSTRPVIFLPGSPTGWLTPAYKLYSTAYNRWTEWNCTQLNSLLPSIQAWPQHIVVIHCHFWITCKLQVTWFFKAYKGISHHPFTDLVIDLASKETVISISLINPESVCVCLRERIKNAHADCNVCSSSLSQWKENPYACVNISVIHTQKCKI